MSLDGQSHRAVLTELHWEPSVTEAHIRVTANHAVIASTGHAGSSGDKHAAEPATRRIKGVTTVAGKTDVRLPFERTWRDDDSGADAGRVHLSRTIRTPHDRLMTAGTAWAAPGALSVENDIPIL